MKEMEFRLTYWTDNEQEEKEMTVYAFVSSKEEVQAMLFKLFEPTKIEEDGCEKVRRVVAIVIPNNHGLV